MKHIKSGDTSGNRPGNGPGNKGFILTLDIMLAVLLTITFLTAFSFMVQDQPRYHLLSKDAHDLLTSLEKMGAFLEWSESAQKQTDLQALVDKLPAGIGGKMSIRLYEYENGESTTFILRDSLWATKGTAKTDGVTGNRMFFNRNELYFGVVALEVWYE